MSSAIESAVLVIDDDSEVRHLVRRTLELDDGQFHEASTGKDGLQMATGTDLGLILTEVALPDMKGEDLIRAVRTYSSAPIIVLAKNQLADTKVRALDAGADDYITKPFSVPEFKARVGAALRRGGRQGTDRPHHPVYEFGGLRLDCATRTLYKDQKAIGLTPVEFQILASLMKKVDAVVPHEVFFESLRGRSLEDKVNTLRVYVGYLRRKLNQAGSAPIVIQNISGVGYRLSVQSPRE